MSYSNSERQYYFPNIIKKVTTAFLSLFTDIRVAKYDTTGTLINYRNVPIVFGSKQKFISTIKKSSQMDFSQSLPRMSVIITGLSYTPAKVWGSEVMSIIKTSVSPETVNNIYRPSSWTLDFTLSIVSLHITEMNQILEQVLPYFNPYKTITIQEFDNVSSFTRDLKVLLKETTPDFMDEVLEEDIRKIVWDINFSIDCPLYKPILLSDLIKTVKVELFDSSMTAPLSGSSNLLETYTYAVSGSSQDSNDFSVLFDTWTPSVSG